MHAYSLYAFKKLIIPDLVTAKQFGLDEDEYNEYSIRTANAFLKNLSAGGLIVDETGVSTELNLIAKPYNLPNFDMAWGFNRYNLGMSITGFLFNDAFGDQAYTITDGLAQTNLYGSKVGETVDYSRWSVLKEQAVRHLDYILGVNPWDISFVMGVGEKTLNHPHNRTASSEASNGSAQRYDYTVPIGALMGGQNPASDPVGGLVLKEDVLDFVVDETCVDYSMVLMALTAINAEVLPPDTLAPQIKNHGWSQIDDQSVLVSWENNELSSDLLYYSTSKNALATYVSSGGKTLSGDLMYAPTAKDPGAISDFQTKQLVTIEGLDKDVTYYYIIVTRDIKGNSMIYHNSNDYFTFEISDIEYEISGVTVCNVTASSAEVTWATNVAAPSTVYYNKVGDTDVDTVLYDDASPSTMFHKVTLTGLDSDTDYEYYVKSGVTIDGPHTFKTQFEFAKLQITACMEEDGNVWFYVNNLENTKDYAGLEFRVYIPESIKVGQYTYWDVNPAQYFYNGQEVSPGPSFTKSFTEESGYNYITLKLDESFVFQANGMLMFKLDISQLEGMDYDAMHTGWSLREHTEDESPYPYYQGIGAVATPNDMIRDVPDPWAGQLVMLPTNYIVAYHNDQHVYGYYPDYDFEDATLQESYDVTVKVSEPINTLFGNSTTIIGDEETKTVTITGTVSIIGEVTGNSVPVGNIQVNEGTADFSVNNSGADVAFTADYVLKEGLNTVVINALDDNDGAEGSCNSGSLTLYLTYKRGAVTKSDLRVLYQSGGEYPTNESGLYKAILDEDLIYLSVNDSDENIDPMFSENVLVTIESPTDTEHVYVSESQVNSGLFLNTANILEGILVSETPSESFQDADRIITAKKNDTIVVRYFDDDSKDDLSIRRILVLEDFPSVEFVDSLGYPTDWYVAGEDVVSLRLRDKLTFEDSTLADEDIILTVSNSSGSDSEKFTLTKDPIKNYYYITDSNAVMNIEMSSLSKMSTNDGVMSVEYKDYLYTSYEVNGELSVDTIGIAVGKQPWEYLDSLQFVIAPNPILVSQLASGKYRIKVSYPDQSLKFTPKFIESIGVKDINATIYDINGGFIKKFPSLTISESDVPDEVSISFDTYWDGKVQGTDSYVQTGVYIIKFKMEYEKEGKMYEKEEIDEFYIIGDMTK